MAYRRVRCLEATWAVSAISVMSESLEFALIMPAGSTFEKTENERQKFSPLAHQPQRTMLGFFYVPVHTCIGRTTRNWLAPCSTCVFLRQATSHSQPRTILGKENLNRGSQGPLQQRSSGVRELRANTTNQSSVESPDYMLGYLPFSRKARRTKKVFNSQAKKRELVALFFQFQFCCDTKTKTHTLAVPTRYFGRVGYR